MYPLKAKSGSSGLRFACSKPAIDAVIVRYADYRCGVTVIRKRLRVLRLNRSRGGQHNRPDFDVAQHVNYS